MFEIRPDTFAPGFAATAYVNHASLLNRSISLFYQSRRSAALAKLNAINRDLGLEEMGELDPLSRGAGDISFVAADVDGLVGMGASGGNSHADGEYVELDSIPRQATRAALLMHRLAQAPR